MQPISNISTSLPLGGLEPPDEDWHTKGKVEGNLGLKKVKPLGSETQLMSASSIQKVDIHPCVSASLKDKSIKAVQSANLPLDSDARSAPTVFTIKTEPEEPIISPPTLQVFHKYDNNAPLWDTAVDIKEKLEAKPLIKPKTVFDPSLNFSETIKKNIIDHISRYKKFTTGETKEYICSRIKERKYNGSIVALQQQLEACAEKDLSEGEVLGHYAGMIYQESVFRTQCEKKLNASQININNYSYSINKHYFISGFGCGNVTTLINAPYTHQEDEDKNALIQPNVCFINHKTHKNITIPFIVATKTIKAGEPLWVDYGKEYWDSARENKAQRMGLQAPTIIIDCDNPIEISDSDSDSAVSSEQAKLKKHISIQTTEAPYSCSSTAFTSSIDLTKHIRIHTEKKSHQCSDCGKDFAKTSNLKAHMRTHTGEKPFQCPVCGKHFTQQPHLTAHLVIHSGEKTFQCSVCGKDFARKSHLTAHMQTHTGEKPFQCNVCSQYFARNNTLKDHIRTHTGEKPFQCDQCDRSFIQKQTLTAHMRTHTGEKPFKCPQCVKGFAKASNLKAHLVIHAGDKPFKCALCSRGFTQKQSLTTHMRTHTGEKPYTCSHCNASYSQRASLNCHKLTHEGVKPYQCQLCEKSYRRASELNKHMTKHKDVSLQDEEPSTSGTQK